MMSKNKLCHWIVFSLISFLGFADGADAVELSVFEKTEEGKIALPVQLVPELVEVTRRVDILPKKEVTPLTPPVDLYRFPVISLSRKIGVELGLDASERGEVDALLRVGPPEFFPEMRTEEVDFQATEFAPLGFAYLTQRKLGLMGDKKWRFSTKKANVEEFAAGKARVSFEKPWSLELQRSFPSLPLSEQSWLKYEYTLPKGPSLYTQISILIRYPGLNPTLSEVWSPPFWGGGDKTNLINLYELMQKDQSGHSEGFLEEVVLHVVMPNMDLRNEHQLSFQFRNLEIYKSKLAGSPRTIFLPVTELEDKTNVYLFLQNHLGDAKSLRVINSRAVGSEVPSELAPLKLEMTSKERVPEIFLGRKFIADRLNSVELSDVLDQRLFVERKSLWSSGMTDVIFRSPANEGRPFISFPAGVSLDRSEKVMNYLLVDYLYERDSDLPLRAVIHGSDSQGLAVQKDFTLTKDRPLPLTGLSKVSKLDLYFPQTSKSLSGAAPLTCLIKKVSFESFQKNDRYHPVKQTHYVRPVPVEPLVLRALPETDEYFLMESEDLQTVRSFSAFDDQIRNYRIQYSFGALDGVQLRFFIRVRHWVGSEYKEKIFSVGPAGELLVPNIELRGFDIMIKMTKGPIPNPIKVLVNKFDVRQTFGGVLGQHEIFEPSRGVYATGVSHQSLESPLVESLRGAYPISVEKPEVSQIASIETSMTLSEVLGKGKEFVLAEQSLKPDNYELKYFESSPSMRVIFGQTFLQSLEAKKREAEMERDRLELEKAKWNIKVLLLVGALLLALIYKFSEFIVRTSDKFLSRRWVFGGIEFLLIAVGFVLYFSKNTTGITVAGVLFILAYTIAVRYRLRAYAGKRWPVFNETNPSGAYFIGFLVMLLFCALNVILKREGSAELAALLSYFLLILSVVIEIFTFRKKYPSQF